MPVEKQKSLNSLHLLRNTLVLGVAVDVLLAHPGSPDSIRGGLVRFPRHAISLEQVADALEKVPANQQLRHELSKLVFRSVISDAFEVGQKILRRRLGEAGLEALSWFWFAKVVRNALDHASTISVRDRWAQDRLPIRWRDLSLANHDQGKSVDQILDHSHAIELVDEIIADVQSLPDDA